MPDLRQALRANPYPGRLVLLARTLDGELSAGYALTGRSASSRARRFEMSADDELIVVPTEGGSHDALRHYVAATALEQWTVFGNGEQVSTVAKRLSSGAGPGTALTDLEYEPDPPIFTPRITAVVNRQDGRCWFGAARHSGGTRQGTDVTVVSFGELATGDLVLLTTYRSDGQTITTAPSHRDLSTQSRDAPALDPRFLIAATVFSPASRTSLLLTRPTYPT